jgi:SAM-dependent methyltransferase
MPGIVIVMNANRATSFGAVADSYDKSKPVAVAGALDWLLPSDAADVVDLGAGTGLLTRVLEARVPHVIAVDPDQRMLAVLGRHSPGVQRIAGTAEHMPLPDSCADAVLASAAWHWFDPKRAPLEIARVLRPGGRVGTVGTILDPEVDWVAELVALLMTDRGYGVPWNDVAAPTEGPFTSPARAEFRAAFETDVNGVIAEVSGWSPVFLAEPAERSELLNRAEAVIRARFPDGRVSAVHRSLCFRCDKK